MLSLVPFSCDLGYLRVLLGYVVVAAARMRNEAIRTVFYAVRNVFKITAALVAQCVQRTVAEQAVKFAVVCHLVTREELALRVPEKRIFAVL